MKSNNKFYNMKNIVYSGIVMALIVNVFLFLENSKFIYYSLSVSGLFLIYSIIVIILNNNHWKFFIDHINNDLKSTDKISILNMPIPLVVVRKNGDIVWYNSKFKNIVDFDEEIINKKIFDLLKNMDWESIIQGKNQFFRHKNGDREYEVIYTHNGYNDLDILNFYFIDISSKIRIEKKYIEQKPVFGYIHIDNFDEILNTAKENSKPFIISEIDNLIKSWTDEVGAILKKIDSDKYVVFLQKNMLNKFIETKFKILDSIRNIELGNKYPITLSIGISDSVGDLKNIESSSFQAIELALGRGGDQAVVKNKDSYEFFGGRNKNVERKSKVKLRVVAQAVTSLIKESGDVYLMGHRYPDLDAIGSAIGMYRFANNLNKRAFIILNEFEEQIAELTKDFENDSFYTFVKSDTLKSRISKEDVLIILDVNRAGLVEDPDVLNYFEKIVVIDHHRKNTDAIDNASLFYIEPYSSSASELVTEMLQYSQENVTILPKEANALLSGIVLDTKGFKVSTGVRTFDAASFLRKKGADTQKVNSYFNDNFKDSILHGNIISNAQIFKNKLAISICDKKDNNMKKIISQAADSIINIKGIDTSFVIGENTENVIFVSARSNGDVNVQIILEDMGGGGHLAAAGAQFNDMSISAVEKILKEKINKYVKGE